jgi:hypothetical protein
VNYRILMTVNGVTGYYGNRPYKPVTREESRVFPDMKSARQAENRLNARLLKTESPVEIVADESDTNHIL